MHENRATSLLLHHYRATSLTFDCSAKAAAKRGGCQKVRNEGGGSFSGARAGKYGKSKICAPKCELYRRKERNAVLGLRGVRLLCAPVTVRRHRGVKFDVNCINREENRREKLHDFLPGS